MTREPADIRRDNPALAFETKLRRTKNRGRNRWGVIVAERRKLRFDMRPLFYDVRGRRKGNARKRQRDKKVTNVFFKKAYLPRQRTHVSKKIAIHFTRRIARRFAALGKARLNDTAAYRR